MKQLTLNGRMTEGFSMRRKCLCSSPETKKMPRFKMLTKETKVTKLVKNFKVTGSLRLHVYNFFRFPP
jgi:hypothetical protein